LIRVEYEELTPVLDPEKAMEPGAPAIHPEIEGIKKNIAYHVDYVRGDGAEAFNQAEVIVGDSFFGQSAHPAYLETQSCTASWDISGRLTMWWPLQSPFRSRVQLARALGIPEHKIRVIQPYVGGGFGGKGGMPQHLYPIAALLSKETGKPVKIVLSRTEEFVAGRSRVSQKIKLRLGLKNDGTMIAKELNIIADSGAFAAYCPAILTCAAYRSDGLYRIPNISVEANLVYTNTIPRGSVRGIGFPQMLFALESLVDMASHKLGIDPVEIRLKNAVQKGDIAANGWVFKSCGLSDSIRRAAKESQWIEKRRKPVRNRGLGIACLVWNSSRLGVHPVYDGSAAFVHIDQYGKVRIVSGEVELGQGSATVFAQIAAEELGIPLEDIEVLPVDSDVSPYSLGTWCSRVTVMGGNAVLMAARDAKRQLIKYAAERLEANKDDLEFHDGKFHVKGSPQIVATVEEVATYAVFGRGGMPITGNGAYTVPDYLTAIDKKTLYGNESLVYPFGTQVAEVLVDTETGKVDVLNIWYAADSGKIINPLAAEGQIEGGVAQGVGYALTEDYFLRKGRVLNPNFSDYKLPISVDIPEIHSIFVETNNAETPYGAKGIGEPPILPTAPAIANAIYDAVGIRIKELPITPEKVLHALQDQNRGRRVGSKKGKEIG
jgi:CO/xanthine dehydrogenase Mo-binding subunit